jgi:hypothetical protein
MTFGAMSFEYLKLMASIGLKIQRLLSTLGSTFFLKCRLSRVCIDGIRSSMEVLQYF